jgi:hypothetical protein
MIPPHVLLDHIKTVIDYINDVKNASKDQKALFDDLVSLQTVLAQLDSNASANDEDWKETMGALSTTGGAFDQLKLELNRMKTKLEPPTGKLGRAGKALGWHFNKDDAKKHFDRIERIKGLLQLALENNHRSVPFKIPLIPGGLRKPLKTTWDRSRKC